MVFSVYTLGTIVVDGSVPRKAHQPGLLDHVCLFNVHSEVQNLMSLETIDIVVCQQDFDEGPGAVIPATEFVQALCLQPPTHNRLMPKFEDPSDKPALPCS